MLIIFKVISVKMCLILSKLIFVIISQKFIHKNVLNKKLMVYSYMFNQIPRWLKKSKKSFTFLIFSCNFIFDSFLITD